MRLIFEVTSVRASRGPFTGQAINCVELREVEPRRSIRETLFGSYSPGGITLREIDPSQFRVGDRFAVTFEPTT